jgi:regulatory protein YycI of two-component signal transduction system YycFG
MKRETVIAYEQTVLDTASELANDNYNYPLMTIRNAH